MGTNSCPWLEWRSLVKMERLKRTLFTIENNSPDLVLEAINTINGTIWGHIALVPQDRSLPPKWPLYGVNLQKHSDHEECKNLLTQEVSEIGIRLDYDCQQNFFRPAFLNASRLFSDGTGISWGDDLAFTLKEPSQRNPQTFYQDLISGNAPNYFDVHMVDANHYKHGDYPKGYVEAATRSGFEEFKSQLLPVFLNTQYRVTSGDIYPSEWICDDRNPTATLSFWEKPFSRMNTQLKFYEDMRYKESKKLRIWFYDLANKFQFPVKRQTIYEPLSDVS